MQLQGWLRSGVTLRLCVLGRTATNYARTDGDRALRLAGFSSDAIATYLQPPALHQPHNSPAYCTFPPAESLKLGEKIEKREAVEAHACVNSFCHSGRWIG